MPINTYRPDLMGDAALECEGHLVAGTYTTFVLTYTVGKFGIDDNGSIKIAYRTTNDSGGMQMEDHTGPGYTTFETDGNASLVGRFEKWRHIRPWSWSLYIQVVRGFLREGDTITVRIGDRRAGSPGFRLQTFCETESPVGVFVDPFAAYDYIQLPKLLSFDVQAGPIVRWRVIAPTLRSTGDAFNVVLVAEDQWGNPTNPGKGVIKLVANITVENLPQSVTYKEGERSIIIRDVVVSQPGTLIINAIGENNQVLSFSNPVVISDEFPYQHYWGDLHVQTKETVGTGTIREMFQFARDIAGLDIVSHQGNDFQITNEFWKDLNQATREYNEDGQFVAIPGFEWSGNTGVGGDHNVWYRNEDQPLFRSSHALVSDHSDIGIDCHTSGELFTAISSYDTVIAAHCGGRYADVTYAHDGKIEHSVEIHSSWGTFEWILNDAFDKNYRVGIVANSDDHKCRPGACYPGASNFGAMGGLTCFLTKEVTRDAIFEAMRRRHHFATTGERLFMEVGAIFNGEAVSFYRDPAEFDSVPHAVDTAQMGDIVSVSSGGARLHLRVVSPSPVERIEIRDTRELLDIVRPYSAQDIGRRIRVIWRGASYRGRARQAKWDGEATISGNSIISVNPINFWNPDRNIVKEGNCVLRWQSTTTGGFSGFDVVLETDHGGKLNLRTELAEFVIDIDDIGYEDYVVDAGGLDRRIQVSRLPDSNPHFEVKVEQEINIEQGRDNAIFACITLENGHQAWSSPIYFIDA